MQAQKIQYLYRLLDRSIDRMVWESHLKSFPSRASSTPSILQPSYLKLLPSLSLTFLFLSLEKCFKYFVLLAAFKDVVFRVLFVDEEQWYLAYSTRPISSSSILLHVFSQCLNSFPTVSIFFAKSCVLCPDQPFRLELGFGFYSISSSYFLSWNQWRWRIPFRQFKWFLDLSSLAACLLSVLKVRKST